MLYSPWQWFQNRQFLNIQKELFISEICFISLQGLNIKDQWISIVHAQWNIAVAEEHRYIFMPYCSQLLIPTQNNLPSGQRLSPQVVWRGAQTVSLALHNRSCGMFPNTHDGEANSVQSTWSGSSGLLSPPCIPLAWSCAQEVQRCVHFSLEMFGFVAFHCKCQP